MSSERIGRIVWTKKTAFQAEKNKEKKTMYVK